MDMVPWDMADGPAPAPVSPDKVEQRFAARGLRAPAAYAAFAAENGGRRFPAGRRYVRDERGELIGFSTVYHYADNQPIYAIDDLWQETEEELGEALVPFATTDCAGLVCLDYRGAPADPRVVSYDFEAVEDRKVTKLAEDFPGFLAALGPKER